MYALLFPALLFVIFIACVAFLYTEGMWGNAIRLINIVTAALLATNFYEPLAEYLDQQSPSYTYFWDFLSLWGLFVVFMIVFRLLTDRASRVKVRFLKIADQVGSLVLAVLIGWVMICFTATTMHTAPLARNFMFGGFQPEKRMFMGLAPDRQWLNFMRSRSRGGFCRFATEAEWKQEKYVFDPYGQFRPKYAERRSKLEELAKSGSFRKP